MESHPLAFCDSTSLADRDLVEVTRQAKDRVGQIQMARFNPAHEWYYFPAMEPGEAALIKTYDSATDGRNRFTIHTAFDIRHRRPTPRRARASKAAASPFSRVARIASPGVSGA